MAAGSRPVQQVDWVESSQGLQQQQQLLGAVCTVRHYQHKVIRADQAAGKDVRPCEVLAIYNTTIPCRPIAIYGVKAKLLFEGKHGAQTNSAYLYAHFYILP